MGVISLLIIRLFQLMAAVTGTIYLKKYREDLSTRYFVYYLWVTFLIEIIGVLPPLIDWIFGLNYMDTFLGKNFWLYNIHIVISRTFYIYYIRNFLKSNILKRFFLFLLGFYAISSVVNFVFSNIFFISFSSYSIILGSLLLFLGVGVYFLQIIQSDEILNFGRSIPFYFSVGTLVFNLCVTPLFIYSKYYSNSISPEFVDIYALILIIANIFMYTCYIIGFLVCYKENKFYS